MKKQISYFADPNDKRLGFMVMGTREQTWPPDALVSITLFEGLPWWRFYFNGILSNLVGWQMKKESGLLYAELGGHLTGFWGVTLSVWEAKSMVRFRDTGAHGTSMRKFRWIFGGKTHTYFLTFPANGRIPTHQEAIEMCKMHARHFIGNQLVRKGSKPSWGKEENKEPDAVLQ